MTAPVLTSADAIAASPQSHPYDIELRQLTKQFDREVVINGVDLQIRPGEFFCILGPSGCGKTTLLRLLAGFETPTGGEVVIQGQVMNRVPPYRRPVNTVFQSYALFNHLTVADNVAFGLRVKRLPKDEVRDRVATALQGVRMEGFATRYPQQLSGGQRQRVALARALVNEPTVILLDEPLGALDLKLRKEMQVELSRLHQEVGLTFVMVTHDQEEALSLSDRIAVVRAGQIEQVGTPSEIYERPRTTFVADFIGDTNFFQGDGQQVEGDRITLQTPTGLTLHSYGSPDTQTLCIRPEKIHLSPTPLAVDNAFSGRLRHVMYLGTHVQVVIELDQTGDRLRVLQPNSTGLDLQLDTPIYLGWTAADCLALVE
ncbi:ABC transporter ATP-binding protein [Spirulina major]|uniref:ABC transporter ATP-binding protein n=1 Tax=Spirulina major TaxID=270636 RepID=UPI00093282EA|nr:ABC transporter ATP-binding protein [Spirulina major]